MVISRRQVHLYSFVVLAVVLPLCFIAGLVWRPNFAPVDASADALFQRAGFVPYFAWENQRSKRKPTLLKQENIQLRVETLFAQDGSDVFINIQPQSDLQLPDVLVYWQQGKPPEELSQDSILLGALSGASNRQFRVPDAMQGQTGHLLLFSQATKEIISTFPLDPFWTQS
ncbi:hypothetical protein [Acaryochloris marina]|uniref:hypothetical protein n=1 Tax=Acaryochloris marina TaxID=155978 RepID=UPI001BB09927|nr:hypothetical protein [Acaryochloris marina]QUY43478.1 hypothetical protein I1H34_04895 [Acaryochloris marina S15]